MKNLAGDPAYSSTMSELFRELTNLQQTVSDKLVLDPASFGIRA